MGREVAHLGANLPAMQNMTQHLSFLLTVSPIIVTFVGQVSCMMGAAVVLPCQAVGILPITYTWTLGKAGTQSPISHTEDRHTDGEPMSDWGHFMFFRRLSFKVVFSSRYEKDH